MELNKALAEKSHLQDTLNKQENLIRNLEDDKKKLLEDIKKVTYTCVLNCTINKKNFYF